MTESAHLPPAEWERVFNVRVISSDGWMMDGVSWHETLTAPEFIRLLGESTFELHRWEES